MTVAHFMLGSVATQVHDERASIQRVAVPKAAVAAVVPPPLDHFPLFAAIQPLVQSIRERFETHNDA